jgi:hypothetical protein
MLTHLFFDRVQNTLGLVVWWACGSTISDRLLIFSFSSTMPNLGLVGCSARAASSSFTSFPPNSRTLIHLFNKSCLFRASPPGASKPALVGCLARDGFIHFVSLQSDAFAIPHFVSNLPLTSRGSPPGAPNPGLVGSLAQDGFIHFISLQADALQFPPFRF